MHLSVCYYAVWWPLPPWQETGSMEQSVLWHFAEGFFFCLFCARLLNNMQAHLNRALKPSLILWRPKYSNFFQQTSSQLALDCQWVAQIPKSIIWKHTKDPFVRYFLSKLVEKNPPKNSMYPLSLLFLLHFFDTPRKTKTYISSGTAQMVFQRNSEITPVLPLMTLVLHTKSGPQLKDFEK